MIKKRKRIYMQEDSKFSDKLHSCVEQVQDQGHDKSTAFAICRVSLDESDSKEADLKEAGRALSKKNEKDLEDALSKITEVISKIQKDESTKKRIKDIEKEAKKQKESGVPSKSLDFTESVSLKMAETKIRADGTVPIKIIGPGWGSSGYYSAELLEKYAYRYKEGTQMFWNHPKSSEEFERPERDLKELAGVLAGDAYYSEDGSNGPGIYADAKIFSPFKQPVEEMGRYMGVSHRANGMSYHGEAEGMFGTIIETIDRVISVDFVTLAGRGGEIVQMIESNRGSGEDMDWSKITLDGLKQNRPDLVESAEKALKESVKLDDKNNLIESLSKENKNLKEAQAAGELKSIVVSAVKEAELPEAAASRIAESYSGNVPLTKENKLDTEKLQESLKDRVKAEKEYIQQITGGQGGSFSMGFSESAGGAVIKEEQTEKELTESFRAMGLSKEQAEVAAKGRV